jgi:hypothetical protein
LAALENRERQKTLELILALNPAADSELYVKPLVNLMWKSFPAEQMDIITRITSSKRFGTLDARAVKEDQNSPNEDEILGRTRTAVQESSGPRLDVTYLRPIVQLLLTRAEYNAMKPWEEQEIRKITSLYDTSR